VLLEDTCEGRPGDGSAGLLLGDPEAFASVTLSGIGGYAEYVDLALKEGRRGFALGLYEFPSMPGPEETRAYFRRSADAEAEALAALAGADLDKPLKPLPADDERAATIASRDAKLLTRPAETWRPVGPPDFPWASRLAEPPVKVALLCRRWCAYETVELARRLAMDVEHLYFDAATALVVPDYWPYRNQTGIGPLSLGVAQRHGLRICSDPGVDAILIAGLNAGAIPERVRETILAQVRAGKGLMLVGGGDTLTGWPEGLTAQRDDSLVEPALAALPWAEIPGLREGERGRITEGSPLAGYRYGQGRVVSLSVGLGTYSALVPRNDAVEGLEGATDRLLALNALALLAAAGREMPCRAELLAREGVVDVARPTQLRLRVEGGALADALVRVQDDHDTVVAAGAQKLDAADPRIALPPLPAMRRYFVDVALRDAAGNCVGCVSRVLDVNPTHRIEDVRLSPSSRVHEAAVPMVDLADGGTLACEADVRPIPGDGKLTVEWEARDCLGRLLARARSAVGAEGDTRADLKLTPPVTVCHQLDTRLLEGDRVLAVRRDRFTVPVPYPYDDFTFLMWSYAGGEPVVRRENRLCYEMGADMMDLCHMRGYTDAGAAREHELAAQSGLRLVPYVSRIAGEDGEEHVLRPGLFDAEWIEKERASMQVCCRQAAPYRPVAYTLGDENYLSRARYEVGADPETMAAFRKGLQARYGTIAALNAVWRTDYAGFEDIREPMWIEQAAEQTESFAPWFDHKAFLDTAFAGLHEKLAGFVRQEDPGAKVGWDGFLGYHWGAGYDFYKLTRNLELNQVYTSGFPQAEFIRSFKSPDALTGEWGNAIADTEEGFSAIGWHNLFQGHNSCWWWTSWGCDYIPFNPDLSVNDFGRWYFDAAREIKAGPGELLIHARREHSGIAVLYSQADMFAARLASKLAPGAAFQPDGAWLNGHRGVLRAVEDLGYQCKHVAAEELEANPGVLGGYRLLVLPLATCLSDRQVEAIRDFVRRGGALLADGRVGLLTDNGAIRPQRPLDDVFGVTSRAGPDAVGEPSKGGSLELGGESVAVQVLEPSLRLAGGRAAAEIEGTPVFVTNAFGQGRAMLLNLPFALVNDLRSQGREGPALEVLGQVLAEAGLKPPARLTAQAGRPRCIEQVLFSDGDLRYLAFEQDILQRGLPPQKVSVAMAKPAFVYDVRTGRQVGEGPVASWDVEVSRGRPRLFALLPYRVVGLDARAPASAKLGEELPVTVAVRTEPGEAQFHVVHVSVYAPGSREPHRQYSRNVECPAGRGRASIPLALNDPPGAWRLQFRDVASGARAEETTTIAP